MLYKKYHRFYVRKFKIGTKIKFKNYNGYIITGEVIKYPESVYGLDISVVIGDSDVTNCWRLLLVLINGSINTSNNVELLTV